MGCLSFLEILLAGSGFCLLSGKDCVLVLDFLVIDFWTLVQAVEQFMVALCSVGFGFCLLSGKDCVLVLGFLVIDFWTPACSF
jgi:hypothetical protein